MNTLKNVDEIMFQCTHRIESDESNEFLFGNLHLTIFSVFIAMNTLKNVPRITSNDCQNRKFELPQGMLVWGGGEWE